jgi:hypothetical protein
MAQKQAGKEQQQAGITTNNKPVISAEGVSAPKQASSAKKQACKARSTAWQAANSTSIVLPSFLMMWFFLPALQGCQPMEEGC